MDAEGDEDQDAERMNANERRRNAHGNLAEVQRLLRTDGVNPNATNEVRFFRGARRFDFSQDAWTPLMNASSRGHLDVVRELLRDPRVDPTLTEEESWPGVCCSLSF